MMQRERKSHKFSYCSNMARCGFRSLIQIYACLAFIAVIIAVDQEDCNKTKCPGPLAYYRALNCSPVYEKEGDCCATKYNCDYIKERSTTKCYANGNEYEIGEKLKNEDANPCDFGCTCYRGRDGIASFICAIGECWIPLSKEDCYRDKSPFECCAKGEICPENPKDIPICNVNGKEYKAGEDFTVENEPDLKCVCQPGYEGKNIEPFCVKSKRSYCSPDFRHAYEVFNNCTPVYFDYQPPQTTCSNWLLWRCQNDNDTVIRNENDSKSLEINNSNDGDVCYFGNLIMHRGDELNQATDFQSICVKCVCEVPPVPTCQHLSYEKCNYPYPFPNV